MSYRKREAEVAKAAHLSERSLARKMVEETGLTWGAMLRRMRMSRALELLSTTNDSILAVSLQVGYRSLSAFNKAFRDFTGFTPSAFRQRMKDH